MAALYVEPTGRYVGVRGVDPWDEARDAMLYAGLHQVHPAKSMAWAAYGHRANKATLSKREANATPLQFRDELPALLMTTKHDSLHPMHRSVLARRASGARPRPHGMKPLTLPVDTREFIERIALSIFTDMVNSGATFQQTLAAVYLSGCENALAAYSETPNSPHETDHQQRGAEAT